MNSCEKGGISRIYCSELTTMVMASSTKEVWVSYRAVSHQDIPRFDAGVDGYPEDAQTALRHPLVSQDSEHECGSVCSQSETVIHALGRFPSTKPIELTVYSDSSERTKVIEKGTLRYSVQRKPDLIGVR